MRIGASILLQNGYCYQSYHWEKLRPLGYIQNILDIFEEYQVDEISIIRPIRANDKKESFLQDVEILKNIHSLTPISFGGGLRDHLYLQLLHNLPIERLILSSAFLNQDTKLIHQAKNMFGNQAIQAMLPFKLENNNIEVFNSSCNKYEVLTKDKIEFIDKNSNEIIFYDTRNESTKNSFSYDLLDNISLDPNKIVISGGIGQKDIKKAKQRQLVSVLIDNKVLHKEYSIRDYKNAKKM